jgi:hypothetical protein
MIIPDDVIARVVAQMGDEGLPQKELLILLAVEKESRFFIDQYDGPHIRARTHRRQ